MAELDAPLALGLAVVRVDPELGVDASRALSARRQVEEHLDGHAGQHRDRHIVWVAPV